MSEQIEETLGVVAILDNQGSSNGEYRIFVKDCGYEWKKNNKREARKSMPKKNTVYIYIFLNRRYENV